MTYAAGGKAAKVTPAANAAPYVLTEIRERVGFITLNRPEKRNPLSLPMILAIHKALDEFEADKEVKAIILRAGGPVFSAGHDLAEVLTLDEEGVSSLLDQCTDMMEKVRLIHKPVIAQVHALATAAGCQLVASCDLVVASETAAFQTPGVKIGLFCSTPMVPLSKVIPPKIALEMLLTGQPLPAHAAAAHGLVNRVTKPEKLEEETMALARQIIAYAGFVLGLGKEAFYKQLPMGMRDSYAVGKDAMLRNLPAPDAQEGISAFVEKRPPNWTT